MNATAPWIDLPPAPDSTAAERLVYRRAIASMDMIRDLGLPAPDFDRLRDWHRHQIEMMADRIVQRMEAEPLPTPELPAPYRAMFWRVAIVAASFVAYMVLINLMQKSPR